MVKLDNIIHVHAERKIYSLFDYFKVEMQRINTLKLDVTYGGGGVLFVIKLSILHLL